MLDDISLLKRFCLSGVYLPRKKYELVKYALLEKYGIPHTHKTSLKDKALLCFIQLQYHVGGKRADGYVKVLSDKVKVPELKSKLGERFNFEEMA